MPKPTNHMKFKLKDRVKVNAPSSKFHGKRGNIHFTFYDSKGLILVVKFVDIDKPIAFFPHELDHV